MATLLDVAKKLGDLTVAKAPEKTGNLKSKLRTANTAQKIIGSSIKIGERSVINDLINNTNNFTFTIDVSPSGAEYGEWWNTPPDVRSKRRKKLSKKKEFNFYDQAYNSSEFQQILNQYIDTLVDKIEDEIVNEIEKAIK